MSRSMKLNPRNEVVGEMLAQTGVRIERNRPSPEELKEILSSSEIEKLRASGALTKA